MTPFDEVMLREHHQKDRVCQCELYDFVHSMIHVTPEDLMNPGNDVTHVLLSRSTSLKVQPDYGGYEAEEREGGP